MLDQLSVGPLMKHSTSFYRKFFRYCSKETTLYTEMMTANTALHMNLSRLSAFFGEIDDLTVVQLAGSSPEELSLAVSRLRREFNFRNLNLNCGCPSPVAQKGGFGAVLMKDKEKVFQICQTLLKDHPALELSVKCRIGVDDIECETSLEDFVGRVSESGVTSFIVHARRAFLKGVKKTIDNCTVPPLEYTRVIRLAQKRPDLKIILNGGIRGLEEAKELFGQGLFGIMIGRAAFSTPSIFFSADLLFFSKESIIDGHVALATYRNWLKEHPPNRCSYMKAIQPFLDLLQGVRNAKRARGVLISGLCCPAEIGETVEAAFETLSTEKGVCETGV